LAWLNGMRPKDITPMIFKIEKKEMKLHREKILEE
jgi:hypothetical protein